MSRLALILVLMTALVGCAQRVDVGQPIDLVVGKGWSVSQKQVLQDAAECWNLEQGTQLRIVEAATATAAQEVPLSVSDFVCGYANGLTNYVGDLEVQICSLDASSPQRLLTVARHEMGHVLNIRDHADDPLAVMNEIGTESRGKRFRPADRHLFHAANPEFEARDECQVARMIGESPSRPVMVTHPKHGTVVIWASQNGLEVHRPSKIPWPLVATIPSMGVAGWLRAVPTAEGLMVTWTIDTTMRAAEVDLGTEQVKEIGKLAVGLHDYDREVDDLSLAVRGGEIYVGVTEGDVSAETTIYRVDRATGLLQSPPLELPDTWGNVHAIGASLLLASRHPQGVGVGSLGPDGTYTDYLVLETGHSPGKLDSFNSQVVSGDLVVAHRRDGHPIRLHRVKVGGTLKLAIAGDVALPGQGYTLAAVAQGPAGLAVAENRIDRDNFEVFVSLLDPVSLTVRAPWNRISAPDLTDSVQPWLAPHGSRFIAVWRDFHNLASIELRGRCF